MGIPFGSCAQFRLERSSDRSQRMTLITERKTLGLLTTFTTAGSPISLTFGPRPGKSGRRWSSGTTKRGGTSSKWWQWMAEYQRCRRPRPYWCHSMMRTGTGSFQRSRRAGTCSTWPRTIPRSQRSGSWPLAGSMNHTTSCCRPTLTSVSCLTVERCCQGGCWIAKTLTCIGTWRNSYGTNGYSAQWHS